MELERPGPIDYVRLEELILEANAHSLTAHKHDGPEPDCDECVQLAHKMMTASGLTLEHLKYARSEGIAPPMGISAMVDKLLEEEEREDDPWT